VGHIPFGLKAKFMVVNMAVDLSGVDGNMVEE